ncbi:MAG TPA: glutamate 5-kinase [Abditibacteriaceae bacterium]|jgi:glutamate 5-kinase
MKTLVVKIGTSSLVRGGHVDESAIANLARQVAVLREENWRTVVVTSGAIRLGLDTIGRARAVRLPEKQAAAAIGQSLLMRAYRRAFETQSLPVAQLLLTRGDLSDRRRFLNARHTMTQLFRWNVVPIVNENDTVAVDEIRVGDNDTLAALTALVAEANLVLLLSDVDGFYLPGQKKPVARIEKITEEIEAAAGGSGSIGGTGGMRTKVEAARLATQSGIELMIAHNKSEDALLRAARGEEFGTRFLAKAALKGRKRWIAYGRTAQGTLLLNDNARGALVGKGSSLLPIGITSVEGEFDAGALVSVKDSGGEYARGLTNFSAEELRCIAGLHSSQISSALGRADFIEAIHRDNLIVTET